MEKAPDAFRTISEVADELDIPQHVLRFWESRFREIKPMKRGGGRRYYRPDDVDLLRGIRHLLYGEGYTIRGVQRILKDQGGKFVQSVWRPGAPQLKQSVVEEDAADDDDVDVSQPPAGDERSHRPLGIMRQPDGAPATPRQTAPPLSPERREPSLSPQRLGAPPAPSGRISSADLRKLHEALKELTECRAQLDAALSHAAAIGSAKLDDMRLDDVKPGEAGQS